MMRILIVALTAFLLQLFLSALSVPFGMSTATILVVPAALILAVTQFSAHEALACMLLLGFLLDAWMGAPVGLVMSVLALMWLLALTAVVWLGKPDRWISVLFIFSFSLAFRSSVALALGIAGGSQGNWEWAHIFGMPFLDVGVGLLFYRVVLRVLTLFGLCELREGTSQRLARRSPRVRLE